VKSLAVWKLTYDNEVLLAGIRDLLPFSLEEFFHVKYLFSLCLFDFSLIIACGDKSNTYKVG
jgi:hypothetical protein